MRLGSEVQRFRHRSLLGSCFQTPKKAVKWQTGVFIWQAERGKIGDQIEEVIAYVCTGLPIERFELF